MKIIKNLNNLSFPLECQPNRGGVEALSYLHNNTVVYKINGKSKAIPHLELEWKRLFKFKSPVITGDIFIKGTDQDKLKRELKRKKENLEFEYWVYDIVDKTLTDSELKEILNNFLTTEDIFQIFKIPTIVCNTIEDLNRTHDYYVSLGFHGVYLTANRDTLYKNYLESIYEITDYTVINEDKTPTTVFLCKANNKSLFTIKPTWPKNIQAKDYNSYKHSKIIVRYKELISGVPMGIIGGILEN